MLLLPNSPGSPGYPVPTGQTSASRSLIFPAFRALQNPEGRFNHKVGRPSNAQDNKLTKRESQGWEGERTRSPQL